MTDSTTDKEPDSGADPSRPAPAGEAPQLPDYKGAPLDPERGPGLGCFWAQVVLLVVLLIVTPLSVVMSAPSWLSALLLIIVLALLFFVGQTMIFLLRLVAADRRTRRRPLAPGARRTVGQLEDSDSPPDADGATATDDEVRTTIRSVVRGERPWTDLEELGFDVRDTPPFRVLQPGRVMPDTAVSLDDVVAGLTAATTLRQREMAMWAFVVVAFADLGEFADNAVGQQVVEILNDALDEAEPSDVRQRLADLGLLD